MLQVPAKRSNGTLRPKRNERPCFNCQKSKIRCVPMTGDLKMCRMCYKKGIRCRQHVPAKESKEILNAAFAQDPRATSQSSHNSMCMTRPDYFASNPNLFNQNYTEPVHRQEYPAHHWDLRGVIQPIVDNGERQGLGNLQNNGYNQPGFDQGRSLRPDAPYSPYMRGQPQPHPQVQDAIMGDTRGQEDTLIPPPLVQGCYSEAYGSYDEFRSTSRNTPLVQSLNGEQSASHDGHGNEQGDFLQTAHDNTYHIQSWNNGS